VNNTSSQPFQRVWLMLAGAVAGYESEGIPRYTNAGVHRGAFIGESYVI